MDNYNNMGIEAYPLSWPNGWKRTSYKSVSRFKTSFAVARDQLFRELKLMGCENNWSNTKVILSTNVPLRRDGIPLAGQSNPKDPGVSVYFIYRGKSMVIACDTYNKVEDNLYAITKTVEAMRGIERWGASSILERAFTGFAALPSGQSDQWWVVLGTHPNATKDEIREAWRSMAKKHHPDHGGSEEMMSKVNKAYAEATK